MESYDRKKQIPQSTAIQKLWKGIAIYFKDYVVFLKGSSIQLVKFVQLGTYHWGFQMIVLMGLTQSFGKVNQLMFEIAPHLVKGGIEY